MHINRSIPYTSIHITNYKCAKTNPDTKAKSAQKHNPSPAQIIDYQSLNPNPKKIKSAQFYNLINSPFLPAGHHHKTLTAAHYLHQLIHYFYYSSTTNHTLAYRNLVIGQGERLFYKRRSYPLFKENPTLELSRTCSTSNTQKISYYRCCQSQIGRRRNGTEKIAAPSLSHITRRARQNVTVATVGTAVSAMHESRCQNFGLTHRWRIWCFRSCSGSSQAGMVAVTFGLSTSASAPHTCRAGLQGFQHPQ